LFIERIFDFSYINVVDLIHIVTLTWTESSTKKANIQLMSWILGMHNTVPNLFRSLNISGWFEPLLSSSRENFVNLDWNTVSFLEAIIHNENFECNHHGNVCKKCFDSTETGYVSSVLCHELIYASIPEHQNERKILSTLLQYSIKH
jgi:hypothetical protein